MRLRRVAWALPGLRPALLSLALLLVPAAARAQTCSVSTSGGLAFGNYLPSAALPKDTMSLVTVSCNATVGLLIPYSIRLQSASGRQMPGPRGTLGYLLATDALFADPWPEGRAVPGSILLTLGALFGSRQHPVHGRLATGQMAGPGAYSDTLMVLVTY